MDNRFIWTDVETFGLNALEDPIIEVGFIITDLDLKPISTWSELVWEKDLYDARYKKLQHDADRGDSTAKLIHSMHGQSALFLEAQRHGVGIAEAEHRLNQWLGRNEVDKADPLCGSSVQFDREMFREQMPAVEARFSYRNIDVSTLKELCRRLNPDVYSKIGHYTRKRETHRVLSDIHDTISEFNFYMTEFLMIDPAVFYDNAH